MQLGHAAVQAIADEVGADVLHVKGFAVDESLRFPGRAGTDVDVLVRPAHVGVLTRALQRHGWELTLGFEEGSSWEHAATFTHRAFGHADVHRRFPGLGDEPARSFDHLWSERTMLPIAGRPVPVPSLPGQALILLLHAGKAPREANAARDIEQVWRGASPEQRAEVAALRDEIGAHIGVASALGNLDDFRSHPEYPLWSVSSRGGTRVDEWRARVQAAGSWRARLRLVLRAPLVNVAHMAEVLGRRPTRAEIVREFFARPLRGLREELTRWRAR